MASLFTCFVLQLTYFWNLDKFFSNVGLKLFSFLEKSLKERDPIMLFYTLHVDVFSISHGLPHIYILLIHMHFIVFAAMEKNEAFQKNGYPAIATALIKESVGFEDH